MTELSPNIDANLASIRARMNDDGSAPPPTLADPTPPPAAVVPPPVPIATLGAVEVTPATAAAPAQTLEGLIRSLLEPLLQQWLDAHMPEIVERLAQAEIKRLTGKD